MNDWYITQRRITYNPILLFLGVRLIWQIIKENFFIFIWINISCSPRWTWTCYPRMSSSWPSSLHLSSARVTVENCYAKIFWNNCTDVPVQNSYIIWWDWSSFKSKFKVTNTKVKGSNYQCQFVNMHARMDFLLLPIASHYCLGSNTWKLPA